MDAFPIMATTLEAVKHDSIQCFCGDKHTEHGILTQRNFFEDTKWVD